GGAPRSQARRRVADGDARYRGRSPMVPPHAHRLHAPPPRLRLRRRDPPLGRDGARVAERLPRDAPRPERLVRDAPGLEARPGPPARPMIVLDDMALRERLRPLVD